MSTKSLTIRIYPLIGESLYSYLFRLASKNGMSFLSLLKVLKLNRIDYPQHYEKKLIDTHPTSIINLEKFEEITKIKKNVLFNTSFYHLINKFDNNNSKPTHGRLLLGLLSTHLRYCPDCITERPYYQLKWRIKEIKCCLNHEQKLVDKCSFCMEKIKFEDINDLLLCPYCNHNLTKNRIKELKIEDKESQLTLHTSFDYLLQPCNWKMNSQELAMKMLFVAHINDKSDNVTFSKNHFSLLQYARNTHSRKKNLNVKSILKFLLLHKISFYQLRQQELPQSFIDLIISPKKKKYSHASCQARWCKAFNIPDKLLSTGPNFKRRVSGEKLFHYMACIECGCEYAFSKDKFIERTDFIEAYTKLRSYVGKSISFKECKETLGYSNEKTRRILAYFYSRNLLVDSQNPPVEEYNVEKIIQAINDLELLKNIQKWNCWRNYDQFLKYRYHYKVMKALLLQNRKRDPKVNQSAKQAEIKKLLINWIDKDIDISLQSVSKHLEVAHETIRAWKCNNLISTYKKQQLERRNLAKRNIIIKEIDKLFESKEVLSSTDAYKKLGLNRTLLHRNYPGLTNYLSKKVAELKLIEITN